MSLYYKTLNKITPKDFKKSIDSANYDISLYIVGIFETTKAHWTYYLVSGFDSNKKFYMTNDICTISSSYYEATINNISSSGRKLQSMEEGLKWAEDFKVKWETGSNDTIAEKRDQKLNEILS